MSYTYKFNALSGEFDMVAESALLKLKGTVDTTGDLPLIDNEENDCYIVKADDRIYTWNKATPTGELSDWLDVGKVTEVDWSIITNKPSSSVADIDDAVDKKHTQNTDDKILKGDSKVEVVDVGTGYVTIVTDNIERVKIDDTGLNIPTAHKYKIGGNPILWTEATRKLFVGDIDPNITGLDLIVIGDNIGKGGTNAISQAVIIGVDSAWNIEGSSPENVLIGLYVGHTLQGVSNVVIGAHSASVLRSGYNVVIGCRISEGTGIGSGNVLLGYKAGHDVTTSSAYNIFIGYRAGHNETGSNKLYIENSDSANPLIYGEFDNDLVRINGDLEVTGELIIKVYSQASEPTLDADNKMAIWIDTDDANRTYLLFRRGSGDQTAVELA